MYYEVYIDILFCLNFWMDYLILRLTAYIFKYKTGKRMTVSACIIALLGSLAVCFVQIQNSFQLLCIQCLICIIGVMFAFPYTGIRRFAQLMAVMQVCSFLLGGAMEWLLRVGRKSMYGIFQWLFASYMFYKLFRRLFLKIKQEHRLKDQLFDATLYIAGQTLQVKAFLDTGNQLKEPLGGRPVSVLGGAAVERLPVQDGIILIPYRAVGTENGILYGFVADKMKLVSDSQTKEIEKPVIGIANESVSIKQDYEMLLSPLLFC